jgi:catechol 2,3-dioxygenase-like lactoylglutathione lyase family enzyme
MASQTTKAPNITQAVPFFMITEMERSLPFYVEGLGFTLVNQWVPKDKIEWCWLQRGGGALMLQTLHKEMPGRGLGVSVCFQCQDALALYHEFVQHGLKPNEPFVGNNMWVVTIKDPDGYNLDFESPTDVPEETKYSDWNKSNNKV